MKIGERIYEQRTAKGLSQEQLAELLEVSRQSVSKWETDGAVPELDKLLRMCDIFEITLDQLTGREGRSPVPAPDTPQKAASITALTPVKVLGIVLIGVALLGGVLAPPLLVMYPGNRYVLRPLLLAILACGVICLCLKQHVGYWCTWSALFPLCFLTPHIAALPVLSVIGGLQLLCFAAVVLWAAKRFPPLPVRVTGKWVALLISLCLLCLSGWAAALFLVPYFVLYYLLLNGLLYAALVVLLTYVARCIKTLRTGADA
ncbi:MAG: helix-turn-helix transcriptional regulator [Clostridia bacterium]|nr:helix-turn-helix transcriptional regulator [Clostridia bacterium]